MTHNRSTLNYENGLIRALGSPDLRLIAPHLIRININSGETILSPGLPFTRILFPETAVIAFHEERPGRRSPAIGMVGREGVVGWSLLLGAPETSLIGIAQLGGGTALTIDALRFRDACDASPTLRMLLLRFVHNFMAQMAGTIASNAADPLDRRVARWLLMLHDRAAGDQLRVTHDHVSVALNVRRASVTDCFHILEGDRVLRCERGIVTIRDRVGLERIAGKSYGSVEAEYVRSIAPFGRALSGAKR